jgi:hypothetical protein
MIIMAEASRQWTAAPTGPSIRAIYLRLVAEAKARGEIE